MTSKEAIAYIRARTQEVGKLFAEADRKKYRVPRLHLDTVEKGQPTSPDFRLEAWLSLNKKIVANSLFSLPASIPRTSSALKSGRRTPLPASTEHPEPDPPSLSHTYIEKQVAQQTAPLLNPKLLFLEATQAIAEKQLAQGEEAVVRKRALEASARKQLKLVHQGTVTARSQTRTSNPFHLLIDPRLDDRENYSRISKSRSAASVRESMTGRLTTAETARGPGGAGKYRELFHKYFENHLLDMQEKQTSDRVDSQLRFSLLQLKKSTSKTEIRLKPEHTHEAVALFKREKLAFVYGPQFRGRYISRTHGDLLKN